MKDNITIAIASDLHCTYDQDLNAVQANTYLMTNLMRIPIERNPMESIKKVIDNEKIIADILLCPGDITDKINSQGLITGWQHLESLRDALKARVLAATIGNHDVDSRHTYSSNPFNFIKSLSTNFPTNNITANDHYWANNFCILEDIDCDILIFNSSYSHIDKSTCIQSNISSIILSAMRNALDAISGNNKIKIAMCHHHPIKHSDITYVDSDSIDKGDELINLLIEYDFTLMIHGHKHDPRLIRYESLPIFCSGSFSSTANLLNIGAQNTFHLIEIDKTSKDGTIKSWVYGPKDGWQIRNGTYFPCYTGFSNTIDVNDLAQKCYDFVASQEESTINYKILTDNFPKLKFLLPSEQRKINSFLMNKSIELTPQLPDLPKIVSKQYL